MWLTRAVMDQVDTINVSFAIIIFLVLGFREPHCLASHAPAAYCAVMALLCATLALPWLARDWCACATSRQHAACCLAGVLGWCAAVLHTRAMYCSFQQCMCFSWGT